MSFVNNNKLIVTLVVILVFILIYILKSSGIIGIFVLIITILVIWLNVLLGSHDPNNEVDRVSFEDVDFSDRPRVVVSFTTIPSRTQFIPTVINKLRKQSFKPDMIYVNVPYHSKRMNKPYTLPDDLNMGSDVKIVRCEDFGPATKLLGAIPEESDPDTCIITIDDDQDYHEDTLKTLVLNSMKYPDKVIAFRTLGLDLIETSCPIGKNIKSPDAYYIEGYAGVLYKRSFINDDIFSFFKNLSHDCFLSDDLTISKWLDMQGIEKIKLCDFQFQQIRTTDNDIDSNDALRNAKRLKVYYKCSHEMNKQTSYNLLQKILRLLRPK